MSGVRDVTADFVVEEAARESHRAPPRRMHTSASLTTAAAAACRHRPTLHRPPCCSLEPAKGRAAARDRPAPPGAAAEAD